QAIIRKVVTEAHPEQEYQVLTQEDILGVVGRILGILTLVLASIAGISLVVGGVGVMNIMLVSVSERTREIGLRKAVGARTRDVLRQFLLEAVALTVSGGVVGILVGIGGALLVGRFSPVPAAITGWSVALAFGVSVAVGVFFGVWPARKAARMQPIVALRYEGGGPTREEDPGHGWPALRLGDRARVEVQVDHAVGAVARPGRPAERRAERVRAVRVHERDPGALGKIGR